MKVKNHDGSYWMFLLLLYEAIADILVQFIVNHCMRGNLKKLGGHGGFLLVQSDLESVMRAI